MRSIARVKRGVSVRARRKFRQWLSNWGNRTIKLGENIVEYGKDLYLYPEEIERLERIRLQSTWYRDKGDETHRLNYRLTPNSIVFDLGGFEGGWASQIYDRFGCRLYIFEPVPEFVNRIRHRFGNNPSVKIVEAGLADKTAKISINMDDNASSLFRAGGEMLQVKLIKADEYFTKEKITKVDLMKINIEGGEYDLLDHLIGSGLVKKVHNIQVQFHNFVPNAERRMESIQNALRRTHKLTYQYPFVWENWKLK